MYAFVFGAFIDLFINYSRTQLISTQIAAVIFRNSNVTIPDLDCNNVDPFRRSEVMGFPFDLNLTFQLQRSNIELLSLTITNTSNYPSILNRINENGNSLECLDREAFIQGVNTLVYVIVTVSIAIFLFAYLEVSVFQIACERQVKKIRLAFYRAIMRQEVGWFDANPSGELTSRMAE